MIRRPGEILDLHPKITFQRGFGPRIVADANKLGDTALPLVSLLLRKLRRPNEELGSISQLFQIEDYEKLGGLEGIVATLVTEIGDEVDLSPLPRLFEKLVEFRDRRPVMRATSRDELIAAADGNAQLVDQLVRARLLHVGEQQGRATVRIAHDTLGMHWDRLRDWIKSNEYDLSLRDEIRRDAETWARRGRREADVRVTPERLREVDELLGDKPGRFGSDQLIADYLKDCHIRIEREALIVAVKGGRLTFACAAMRKLRELGVEPLLQIDDRGTENRQLEPAFWAAITGIDLTNDILLSRGYRDIAPRTGDPSIFDGKGGRVEMARTTSRGLTPIFWAAAAGQERLVRKLTALGANMSPRTDENFTTVQAASVGGHLATITFLVEQAGIDPRKPSRDGSPPIIWTIQERHREATQFLRDKGQSFNIRTRYGWNALTEAARADDVDLVRDLIDNWGHSINCRSKDGQTPLHVACRFDRRETAEVVKLLLEEYQADLCSTTVGGATPLHLAASSGKISAIDVLVDVAEQGGRLRRLLDAKDSDGWTALHAACWSQKSVATERLLAAGSDPNIVDAKGCSALHYAVQRGDRRSAQALLDKGAKTDLCPLNDWPLLCLAADDGDLDMIERLASARSGIDLNATVRPGWTALMIAARKNHADIIEALLAAGASASHVTADQQDVISVADRQGNRSLVAKLKGWARDRTDMVEALERQATRERRRAAAEGTGAVALAEFELASAESDPAGYFAQRAAAGDVAAIRSLLAGGIDPVIQARALRSAAAEGRDEIVDILLARPVDVVVLSDAAKAAASAGKTETARHLIARGAAEPLLWHLPRISDTATFLSFSELDTEALRSLKARMKGIQSQLVVRGDQARLRCATLSWLPGHRLVAIEDPEIPGQNEQFAIELEPCAARPQLDERTNLRIARPERARFLGRIGDALLPLFLSLGARPVGQISGGRTSRPNTLDRRRSQRGA